MYVARLRTAATRDGQGSPVARLVSDLQAHEGAFVELWDRQEVGLRWSDAKRFVHPQLGRLDLHCQTLLDPDQSPSLLVFTATQDAEKLDLLAVLGKDRFPAARGGGPEGRDVLG